MVLQTCARCSIRYYAPEGSSQALCWRCERDDTTSRGTVNNEVADRLLAQVFPDGIPSSG